MRDNDCKYKYNTHSTSIDQMDCKVTLAIVIGPSGAGKTTIAEALARRHATSFIEGDQLHPPQNIAKMSRGEPLNDDDRWPWLRTIRDRCSSLALELRKKANGKQTNMLIVVCCSALKLAYRNVIRQAQNIDRIVFIFPRVDYSKIRARLEARQGHFMKVNMLDSQLATLEIPNRDTEPNVIQVNGDDSIEKIIDFIDAFLFNAQQLK